MIALSNLNECTGVRHAFFTREGGVSGGIYASLNCGFGSGDDPEAVRENRARAMAMMEQKPEALITLYQEHTARVVKVEATWDVKAAPVADAMVTDRPGIALGILTADCAPVLFAAKKGGVIGAAHAGWKGALSGVLEATLRAMADLGAKPEDVIAAIGPCITRRSYEVGPEFPAPFLAQSPDNDQFFSPSAKPGHHYFDLPGYALFRLAEAGVGHVINTPCDTYRDAGRFFSYRRATHAKESSYGRGLSAIVIEK